MIPGHQQNLISEMTKGFMYILVCGNGNYYIGSTTNLELRIQQHNKGVGANFASKHLPIRLIYHEEFESIGLAFRREKQLQKWSRSKKEALIKGDIELLKKLSRNRKGT